MRRRNEIVSVRLTATERDTITARARTRGLSLGALMRQSALDTPRRQQACTNAGPTPPDRIVLRKLTPDTFTTPVNA